MDISVLLGIVGYNKQQLVNIVKQQKSITMYTGLQMSCMQCLILNLPPLFPRKKEIVFADTFIYIFVDVK